VTLFAYRYALDPAPRQERALRSHAGATRAAFNWGLARVRANLDQRAAEATYGIGGDNLTPSLSWSLYSLRKAWNAAKDTVAPWWGECSKEAFNTGLDQLARALKNWGDSRNGKWKGRPVRFPRFRSRQVEAQGTPVDPVHHRRDPLRDPACGPAEVGADQAPRTRRPG